MDFFYKISVLYEKNSSSLVDDYIKKVNNTLENKKGIGMSFCNKTAHLGDDRISQQVWLIDKDFYINSYNEVLVKQYCNGAKLIVDVFEKLPEESLNCCLKLADEMVEYENFGDVGMKIRVSAEKLKKIGLENLLDYSANKLYEKEKKK